MSAPVLFWAKFVTGSAQRVTRRGLTKEALDRLRESVEPQTEVQWGIEARIQEGVKE